MSVFSSIALIGVDPEMDFLLKKKYGFTNILAFSLLLLDLGLVIFMIVSDELDFDYYSASLILVYISTLLLNRFQKINASRFLICNVLPLLLNLAHLSNIADPYLKSLPIFILQLTFSTITWVLFELSERKLIVSSALINFAILIWFVFSDGWGKDSHLVEMFNDSSIFLPFSVLMIAMFLGMGFLVKWISYLILKDNKILTQKLETNHQLVEEKTKALDKHVQQLEKKQEEEKKEQWINQSLAHLSGILQQSAQKAHQLVFDELLQAIVSSLKVNQGVFYLKEEENGVQLRIKSVFAFERKKYINKSIVPGEGLVGQAYLEKNEIYLEEVPENYVRITSGLGEALPRAILIMPCLQNDQVEGMIELASFHKYQEHELEYIRQVGVVIASFLNSYRISLKTTLLLEETQMQTEQMREQEEEMRQNLEEFKSVQEELEGRVKRYEEVLQEHKLTELIH